MSSHRSKAAAWRFLKNVRPSYILLISAVPFVLYLFLSAEDYQAAFSRIAPGLWLTVLVTVLSYVFAALLGLVLAGLLILRLGKRTLSLALLLALLLGAGSAFFFSRPHATYSLAGAPEGRVAIIQGTPGGLSERIQRGNYRVIGGAGETGGGGEIGGAGEAGAPAARSIRAVVDVEGAYGALESGTVTAVFVPTDRVPTGAPVLWTVSFLPPNAQGPALALLVFCVITLLLAFAAWQSGEHPLAIFAELYVDMIRGIPMLVIILYVGFPLQGAIRDATGGFLEPSRLARGVIAISLGYAAYMAEIFRAGIQAVAKGQIEASRSLGLSGWQTARFVVLPQALRIVIPPLGNEFIAMLKDTSLLSLLSLREVTQRTREFTADTFEYFPGFNTVAVLYIGLTLAASSLIKFVERRTEGER